MTRGWWGRIWPVIKADAVGAIGGAASGNWLGVAAGAAASSLKVIWKLDAPISPSLAVDSTKMTLLASKSATDLTGAGSEEYEVGLVHNRKLSEVLMTNDTILSCSFNDAGTLIKNRILFRRTPLTRGGGDPPSIPFSPGGEHGLFPGGNHPSKVDSITTVYIGRLCEMGDDEDIEDVILEYYGSTDEVDIIDEFCQAIAQIDDVDDAIEYTNGFLALLEESDLDADTLSIIKSSVYVGLNSRFLWNFDQLFVNQ